MLDDFLIRAALAGIGIALAAAPLGCFVVWRRMAFFGDATAHAAILGVALALALELPVFLGAVVVALLMAFTVSTLSDRGQTMDTLLGVLSHAALALGLIAVSLLPGIRVDLGSILFGDILTVDTRDLMVIWCGALLVLGLVCWRWQALLLTTLNADLAAAMGIAPRREQHVLTIALAIVVAAAIKVVGVLLIAALLIIPAAAARPIARTPEAMALIAAGIGSGAVAGGLWASLTFDTPAGPSIVAAAAVAFVVVSAAAR